MTGWTTRWPVLSTALLALAGLSACDLQRADKLEEGVSTEANVYGQFGEPAKVYEDADGGKTLEYTRQPAGQVNYMISIGPDGKMSALRQVLKPVEFAKITPGLDQAQVRRLIGAPAKQQTFELKKEVVWDWRWADGATAKVFSVTFDLDGKVMGTAVTDESFTAR